MWEKQGWRAGPRSIGAAGRCPFFGTTAANLNQSGVYKDSLSGSKAVIPPPTHTRPPA